MCVHVHTHTHAHPSRCTSETCQQVIIFHADGSELLGAFQLHSLFKLRFLSLHLFLNPGAPGQQTCSALPVLPLLAPIKNCCPELYNFQSKHERYFTTQPCPGAELSYLSVKSVQLLSYSFVFYWPNIACPDTAKLFLPRLSLCRKGRRCDLGRCGII